MKRQRSLLLSTSALTFVTALGVLSPGHAVAACTTVSGNTTITDSSVACITWTGGTISISSIGNVTSSTIAAITNSGSTVGNLNNAGTINSGSTTIIAITSTGTIGTISNSGLITGNSGLYEQGGSITSIINTGTIVATNSGGIGICACNGIVGSIENDGTINGVYRALVMTQGGGMPLINNTAVLSANTGIYDRRDTLTLLTNSGIITGANGQGIWNSQGNIVSVANTGTISGTQAGIYNNGSTFGTVTNSRLISGGVKGINNDSTFTMIVNNAGATIHGGTTGIFNGSAMSLIANSGTISGANGVYNGGGTITSIFNASTGTISGTHDAIYNGATLTSLTNSGVISGGQDGITNAVSIGEIINNSSGTISGVSLYAIDNGGVIGGGATAINSAGSIVGVIQNTGTISGNVFANQSLTLTGSLGTLTGGTISTGGHDLIFDNHANQILQDAINVGANNTVSLAGTLNVGGVVSITGNFTETSSGTLDINVTNSTTYGQMNVSGNANLAGDFISIGGTLAAGETLTIVQGSSAASSYTGALIEASGFLATTSSIVSGGFNSLLVSIASCSTTTISSGSTFSGSACGVVWTGGSLSIASTGYVSGSASAIKNSASSVGALSNSGTLVGSSYGIFNSGTITTITNNGGGFITGALTAIKNSAGTIGALVNNGTIITNHGDAITNSGSFGSISNIGLISAGSGPYGINNTGSINAISNNGTITAQDVAIYNQGSIGQIINNAGATLVSTQTAAIYNQTSGTISTIVNSGLIHSAGEAGIYVNATTSIGTIINNASGIISAGSAFYGAIYNGGGTIGVISNSGLIQGPDAIHSTGTILSALSNSGTISGMINASQTLTLTGGSVGGLGTLTGFNGTIGTITTNNHDLTFDGNAFQLLDDNINVGASNTVFNNGLIRVNSTHSIAGNYTQGSGGTLVVGVTDINHYGQLIVSGAATMTNGQVLIAPTAGSLTSGETFTIVQAATAGTNYSGVVATASGFTVTTTSIASGGYEDLIVVLSSGTGGSNYNVGTYEQVGQQTGGSNGAAVGAALEQIQTQVANGSNTNFVPILTALNTIGLQQGAAAEGAAIKQLTPGQLSAGVAASNLTATQSMMVIGQHQQTLRSQGNGTVGRSAGSEYKAGNLWMQVSGGFANSTTAGAAFHQDYYGLTFGADYHLTKSTTLGLAAGWNRSMARGSNDLSGDTVSTSTPEVMGYGTYRIGRGYIDASAGIGYNMFNQNRPIGFLNEVATAKYNGMQYMGNVEGGYDFAVTPRTTMTPLLGFQAIRTDTDSYTESGAGAADSSVAHQIIDSYSTLLGGRVTTALPTALGSLLPEAKLAWAHDLNHSPISSQATLAGVNFATSSPRISPDGAEVTLGATLQKTDSLTLRAEYDGDLRLDYQSHTGLIKGSLKF